MTADKISLDCQGPLQVLDTLDGTGFELRAGAQRHATRDEIRRDLSAPVLLGRKKTQAETVPNADLILKIAMDELNNWDRKEQEPEPMVGGKIPLLQELEEMIRKDAEAKLIEQFAKELRKRNPTDKEIEEFIRKDGEAETSLLIRPIILVPCNKNSPVNILNAQQLLQDGVYDKLDQEKAHFFDSTRPEAVEVVRNIRDKKWRFEVRDSAKGFKKEHWHRVVAVITDGADWQFKGWPFENIVDLFTSIKGVYFTKKGDPLPEHVAKWQVCILEMSTLQYQHRFSAIRDAFWAQAEHFLNSARHKTFVNHTTLEGIRKVVKMTPPVL
ncbi:unnamed protein product [Polarella glacialis]|uniref:Cell division control protein 73 C-terminal domain-containing protein n=1 Tax=Polarella glacialis TaxID=89957 RepID=A0A813JL16_POLGL|nr:unnamed protein product [Polarella glacialis]